MAINPSLRYTGKITAPSASYPLGSARDITTPGDGTGTPWEQNLVNDIWGLLQRLLAQAGITASDTPDTALVSQYYQALMALLGRASTYVFENTTTLAAGTTILGETVVFVEKQILTVQAEGALVRFFVVTTDSTSPNISLGGGLYAEEVFPTPYKSNTVNVVVTSSYVDTPINSTWTYFLLGNIVFVRMSASMTGTQAVEGGTFRIDPATTWPTDMIHGGSPFETSIVMVSGGNTQPGFIQTPTSASASLVCAMLNSGIYSPTNFSGTKGLPYQNFSYIKP